MSCDTPSLGYCPVCGNPLTQADVESGRGEPDVYSYQPCGCREVMSRPFVNTRGGADEQR
jgi:hypothetical protein